MPKKAKTTPYKPETLRIEVIETGPNHISQIEEIISSRHGYGPASDKPVEKVIFFSTDTDIVKAFNTL